jgi:hypothetical protein
MIDSSRFRKVAGFDRLPDEWETAIAPELENQRNICDRYIET